MSRKTCSADDLADLFHGIVNDILDSHWVHPDTTRVLLEASPHASQTSPSGSPAAASDATSAPSTQSSVDTRPPRG